ncbi:MAG TPA: ABC transporter substrate-binding protein, partial [Micrococcaceae bacterium]
SDKFEPFTTQPKNGGVITGQNGPWGYYSATPITADPASATSSTGFNPAIVVVPVVVVLLGAGAFLLYRRRIRTAGDRE